MCRHERSVVMLEIIGWILVLGLIIAIGWFLVRRTLD
jgi:hypothetical protein